MYLTTKGLLATVLSMCPLLALAADAPSGGVAVGNDTVRDFFVAHKDAKLVMRGTNQLQTGVLTSIGQDHFCFKAVGSPDSAIWCNQFATILYYNFDGSSIIYSFNHP
jgi:hypothetical protein